MYIEDIFIDFIFPVILFICVLIFFYDFKYDQKENIEMIKNTKEYYVYDKCYSLDDKYYCYNLEK